MKWEISTLGEIVKNYGGKIQTGPFGSQLHQHDYKPEGTPVVMPKNIVNDKIDTTSIARISESDADRLSKHKLNIGDLILPRRGDLNKRAICKQENEGWLCGTGCLKIRLNDVIVDPSYLYYYFSLSHVVENILNKAVGSTMLNLSGSILSSTELVYPPLPTQRKIASILSAYDDLIENNLKRIKLLEDKLQLHYKELLQGSSSWEKVKLEQFVSVVKGRKPINVLNQPEEDSQLYLLLDTIEKGKTLYTTDLSLPQSKITDVLMCMDGARSGLCFRGMTGAIGSTMAIWRSNSERVNGEFLFQFMKQHESAITQGNTGAAIPHANRKFILDMEIAMPSKKEAYYFDELTIPIIKLINTLHQQNTKLREARDILLPKLMNGQIEV